MDMHKVREVGKVEMAQLGVIWRMRGDVSPLSLPSAELILFQAKTRSFALTLCRHHSAACLLGEPLKSEICAVLASDMGKNVFRIHCRHISP